MTIDTELAKLKGHGFILSDALKKEIFQFFSQQKQGDWQAFDNFFEKFTPFWTRTSDDIYYRLAEYKQVKFVFESILKVTEEWETTRKLKVHKGTPFYFFGMASIKNGDIEKGLLLMHQAAQEDKRYGRTDSPAINFITLNDTSKNQFFKSKLIEIVVFLSDQLQEYCKTNGQTLDINNLRKKLLQNPRYIDESFLFVYSIFKYHKYVNDIEPKYRQNPLASYIETDLLFDLCKLCDVVLRKLYPPRAKDRDTLPEKYSYLCEDGTVKLNLRKDDFIQANTDMYSVSTIDLLLENNYKFPNVKKPTGIESDLALAYGLRNFSAHRIEENQIIYQKYEKITKHILNAFFFIVEKKL